MANLTKAWFAAFMLCAAISCSQQGHHDQAPSSKPEELKPITKADAEQALALIDKDKIRAGAAYLSDDKLAGRATGTEGEKMAAQWIEDQFKTIGLKAFNGSYQQPVKLIGYKKNADKSSLSLTGAQGEIAYKNEETLTYWSTSQKPVVALADVPLLFVGYGVEAPEHNWNDYKDADLKGKILIFLNNDPPVSEDGKELFGGEARTYYGRWTYKFEKAMEKGAAGAIVIHTTPSAGYGWSVISDAGAHEGFALDMPNTGFQLDFLSWIHEDLANALAATVNSSLDQWFEDAKSREFKPVTLPVTLNAHIEVDIKKTESQNVAGYVEGSDPQLKDEFIVFTAHYDHLGVGEGEGDTIYNGAWDNALGTSCIVNLAQAFAGAKLHPKRSIVFLACTAEEKGTLGSQWFVANPPVQLKQMVANLNIDMPQIFGTTKDMVAIGQETNSMGPLLKQVAAAYGWEADGAVSPIQIKGDANPNAGSFYRSDQLHFARGGIPALFLNPGLDYIGEPTTDPEKYEADHYHQPSDQIDEFWDLSGCERDMKVVYLLAMNIANGTGIPTWNPGNEFETAFNRNHGK